MRRALLDEAADAQGRLSDLQLGEPIVVFENSSLRDVVNLMAAEGVGRFPVVPQDQPRRLIGIVSRSDVLAIHRRQRQEDQLQPSLAR
jgi:CBS domain-containing protein